MDIKNFLAGLSCDELEEVCNASSELLDEHRHITMISAVNQLDIIGKWYHDNDYKNYYKVKNVTVDGGICRIIFSACISSMTKDEFEIVLFDNEDDKAIYDVSHLKKLEFVEDAVVKKMIEQHLDHLKQMAANL